MASECKVIVCCGVVGSGKTYFSTALCAKYPEWQRISQDDLGSRPACESAAQVQLRAGRSIIIDRCNFDKKQRSTWIKIARRFNAEVCALELKTPIEKCRQRIMLRQDHPTGVTGIFGSGILDKFTGMYTSPTAAEGFSKVFTINMSSDITWTRSSIEIVLQRLKV